MTNLFERRIMKNYVIVILVMLIGISVNAQKKWSLEEAVTYALENNITVKKGENTLLINDQDIIASKGNFYPSLGANLSQNLNIGNQEVFDGQFVDRTSNSTNIGLGVNQTVFDGFRLTNIYKQAKLNREANELELNRIQDNIMLNVVNSYLNVLFNVENLEIAQAQYDFSKTQLDQIKELVDSGVQPEANLFDAEATLASDEQNLTIAQNNYDLALLSLSQLLQVPYEGFEVEIIEIDQPSAELMYSDVNEILEYAFSNRPEIQVAQMNIENSMLNTEISRSGFYPTVTFGYGFNSNVFFSNLTDTEDPFFTQLNDQKAHNFRLSVNVPIFSRFQNKTNVAKSQIREENSKLDLEQAKIDMESNIQRAFTDAQAALKTYQSAKKSLAAQELAFQNAQFRYNNGAMTTFDLEQVRFRFINAESNLVNAKYDFVFKTKVLDFYLGKPITTN